MAVSVNEVATGSITSIGSGGGGGSGGIADIYPLATANAAATILARSGVWLGADNALPDFITTPQTGLNYPDSDWADVFCIKLNYLKTGINQHILNVGQFGSGTNSSMCLYFNGQALNARLRTSSAQLVTGVGNLTSSIRNGQSWVYIVIRRVSGVVEIAWAPKGGSATTLVSGAVTGLTTLTPNGLSSLVTIGARNDATSSNGQTSSLQRNNIVYWARVNATITNANLESLAAGQDIMADLLFSPLIYAVGSTLGNMVDISGNARILSKVNSPVSRGGPRFSTAPITIANTLDEWYARAFQREQGTQKKTKIITGTYNGDPTHVLVTVLSKAGAQVVDPVYCTYPSVGTWRAEIDIPTGVEYTLKPYFSSDVTKYALSELPWSIGAQYLCTGESIMDQLSTSSYLESGFSPNLDRCSIYLQPDSWQPSTGYTTSTLKLTDSDTYETYKCLVNHTSGTGTFAADRVTNPTYWQLQEDSVNAIDTLSSPLGLIMGCHGRVNAVLGIGITTYFGAKTGSTMVAGPPDTWQNQNSKLTHGKLRSVVYKMDFDAEKILFDQGLNDGNNANLVTKNQYKYALISHIGVTRSYLTRRAQNKPDTFISISGTNTRGNSINDSNFRNIRNGQREAIPLIPNAYHAGEDYHLKHADFLHPDSTQEGYQRKTKMYAQAILNTELPSSYPNGVAGAKPLSWAVSGANTIDIIFNLGLANTLSGYTGNTGIDGFVTTDNLGVVQAATSTVVLSGNTVRLTYVGTPINGWTVDYMGTQVPPSGAQISPYTSAIGNYVQSNLPIIDEIAGVGVPIKPFLAPLVIGETTAAAAFADDISWP